MKKVLIGVAVVLVVLVGGYLGYQAYKNKNSNKIDVIQPLADPLYGRAVTISADKDATITVYNANKVGMTLNIPAGSVDKDTKIKVFPTRLDKDTDQGVMILPDNVNFKKPVELLYDFNLSKAKNNPSGKSIVYEYGLFSASRTLQLVDRPLETKTYLPARIFSAGVYYFDLSGKNTNKLAHQALKLKSPTSFTIIEAATQLIDNHQKLTKSEKSTAENSMNKMLAIKKPEAIELYSALNLKKILKDAKVAWFAQVALADDLYAGYLREVCNDQRVGPDVVLSIWKTAEKLHYDEEAKNCEQRYRNQVAKTINNLLDSDFNSVTYAELRQAQRQVQSLGMDDLDKALVKKIHDKAVKEGEDVLKATNVDPYIITIALQNAQRFAPDDSSIQDKLTAKMNSALGAQVSDVLNNQSATSDDIVSAIGKDKLNNGPNQEKLKEQLAKAVAKEAAAAKADPNTTAERYDELSRNAAEAGNTDLAKELSDKAKTAPKEAKPKVDSTGDQALSPEEEPAFDLNALTVPMLQLFGLTDFSSAGVEQFKQDKLKEFAQMREMLPAMCAAIAEMGGDASECEAQIAKFDDAVEQFGVESDKAVDELAGLEAEPPAGDNDQYDGSNDNSITGECISEEEAQQIDPNHDTYTICPEDNQTETVSPEDQNTQTDTPEEVVTPEEQQDQTSEETPVPDQTDSESEGD